MKIRYRLAEDKDVEAMASFWSLHSGWDIIDASEWHRRFNSSPAGPSVGAVAEDTETNKIIGQFIFIPTNFCVRGQTVKSYRPFAPILDSTLQLSFGIGSLLTGKHPLLKLYRVIATELFVRGIHFIYFIPDPRWSRVLEAFPNISTHRFPLWVRPLTVDRKSNNYNGVNTRQLQPDDSIIDCLWEKSKHNYPIWIQRNTAYLHWKSGIYNYNIFGVFRDQELIGIFSTTYMKVDYQWLIYEIFTIDNHKSLFDTLAAMCSTIEEKNQLLNNEDLHARKISILATPQMESMLSELEFKKEKYNFTLSVHKLNKKQNPATDHPSTWYVGAKD